jgi:hypothetical protein
MTMFRRVAFIIAALASALVGGIASAQDIPTGVTFVCNGERLLVESCNMRDTSDTTSCLVQHPDRPLHNGFVAYTNETRGALRKLLPTCKQPNADQVARVQAFQKKQTDTQEAIRQKNLALMDAPPPAAGATPAASIKSQRDKLRLARCLSVGRSEMQCAGGEFGNAFEGVFAFAGSLIGGVKQPEPGPYMLGTYEGRGGWYIEFSQDIAQMACSDLVNESQDYTLKFEDSKVVVRVENKPQPLVFTLRDGKLYGGSAPVQVAGAIVVGHTAGSGGGSYDSGTSNATINTSTQSTSRDVNPMEAQAYQMGGGAGTITPNGAVDTITETSTTTTYSHPAAPTPSYNTGPQIITAPRTRTCPAPVLSNLHPPQSQDMGSAMSGLAGVFGMDNSAAKKSAPVPAGLRMLGEFAVPGGADIDFHDAAAAIVACGTIAAEYPYTVDVSGTQAVVKLMKSGAPPIALTVGPGHTLTGSGTLQVTGRVATGQDQNGNMAFATRSVSCALGTFSPVTDNTPVSDTQPVASSPANAAAASASAAPSSVKPSSPFATPSKPTGPAVLTVSSGFPIQSGVANPLAGQAYVLLRDPVASVLAKSGAAVPPHVTPQQAVRNACEAQKPECRTYLVAIGADASTGLKADASGKATLPGIPAGTYYLTASAKIGNLVLYWHVKVDLKPGANAITLDTKNAAPVN